ncbi:unnamed protein product [Prorocentrum cordatum]|uniref:RNA-directed RNA polymerase n=1 Tax=Prorocentrum cordatum TaxID=2364126 RepID=A0ABN9V526_9DINO|nr:unnamed protein product [Polarella glacialis]
MGFANERSLSLQANPLIHIQGFAVGIQAAYRHPDVDDISSAIFAKVASETPDHIKGRHAGVYNLRATRPGDAARGRDALSSQREMFYFLNKMASICEDLDLPDEEDSESDEERTDPPGRITKRHFKVRVMSLMLRRLREESIVTNRGIIDNMELQNVFHDAVEKVLLDFQDPFGPKGAGILLRLADNHSKAGAVAQKGIDHTFVNDKRRAQRRMKEAQAKQSEEGKEQKEVADSEMKQAFLEAEGMVDAELIDYMADRLTEKGAFPKEGPALPDDFKLSSKEATDASGRKVEPEEPGQPPTEVRPGWLGDPTMNLTKTGMHGPQMEARMRAHRAQEQEAQLKGLEEKLTNVAEIREARKLRRPRPASSAADGAPAEANARPNKSARAGATVEPDDADNASIAKLGAYVQEAVDHLRAAACGEAATALHRSFVKGSGAISRQRRKAETDESRSLRPKLERAGSDEAQQEQGDEQMDLFDETADFVEYLFRSTIEHVKADLGDRPPSGAGANATTPRGASTPAKMEVTESQASTLEEVIATPAQKKARSGTFDEEVARLTQEKLASQMEKLDKVTGVEAACSAHFDHEVVVRALKGMYDKIICVDLAVDDPDQTDRAPRAVERSGDLRRSAPTHVTPPVPGDTLLRAARLAGQPNRDARQLLKDVTGPRSQSSEKLNADQVRLGMVAILTESMNVWRGDISVEQKKRVLPYPHITQAQGELIRSRVDPTEPYGQIGGHGDGHKKPGYIYKRELFGGVVERTILWPFIHPFTNQLGFMTEREVGLWGYEQKPEVRVPPRGTDTICLHQLADRITQQVRFGDKNWGAAYARQVKQSQDQRMTLVDYYRCFYIGEHTDGAAHELFAWPRLRILLNLMGTLLNNVELIWAVIRLGMRDLRRHESSTEMADIRICEITNSIVHCECWEDHITAQTKEALSRGLRVLSMDWQDFQNLADKESVWDAAAGGPEPTMRTIGRRSHRERAKADSAAYDPEPEHIFSQKTNAEMKELMSSCAMGERIAIRAFPEPDRITRYSDVDLNLKFDHPDQKGLEGKRELVYQVNPIEEFFRFMRARDTRSENSAYSPLPEQSQHSDDENLAPEKLCSACGGAMCFQGADRCARQRRPERLRAVVDALYGPAKQALDTLEKEPQELRELQTWTLGEAWTRVRDFRRRTVRQLTLMERNRGVRFGSHVGRLACKGKVIEPGTGTNMWSEAEIATRVVAQLRAVEDWTGDRFTTGAEDDVAIRASISTRPKEGPVHESLTRQLLQSRAAGALDLAIQAARQVGAQSNLAALLIPSLLEQFLTDCPMADMAPVDYGGGAPAKTKMMILVKILYKVYEKGRQDAGRQPADYPTGILDQAGEIALERVGATLVRSRMNDRKYACILEKGLDEHAKVIIYADVMAAGTKWMQSLGALKASGVRAKAKATDTWDEIVDQMSVLNFTPEDLEADRARMREEGEVLCVSPEDNDIHLVRSELMEDSIRAAGGRQYPVEDEGYLLMKTSNVRSAMRRMFQARQLCLDSWARRLCGTPNHPTATKCRGALTITRDRWGRDVWGILHNDARYASPEYQSIKLTAAWRFRDGRANEEEGEARFRETNLADSIFSPFTWDGAGLGQWVVLCEGTAEKSFGGKFMENDDHRGTTRTMAIFAALARAEGGQNYYESRTDQQIARAVRDEMQADADLFADRATIFHGRWISLWHTAGVFRQEGREHDQRRAEAEANATYSTVDGIAELDPVNILVRQRTQGRASSFTVSLRNGVENTDTNAERLRGIVKKGLTHRCVMNNWSKAQCWDCGTWPHGSYREQRGRSTIAYLCSACNSAGDMRAALVTTSRINETSCPHCGTRQNAEVTKWWPNPAIRGEQVQLNLERIRKDRPGVQFPRIHFGSRQWMPFTPMPDFSMRNLEGLTDENGLDVGTKTSQKHTNWIKHHPDRNRMTNVPSTEFSMLRQAEEINERRMATLLRQGIEPGFVRDRPTQRAGAATQEPPRRCVEWIRSETPGRAEESRGARPRLAGQIERKRLWVEHPRRRDHAPRCHRTYRTGAEACGAKARPVKQFFAMGQSFAMERLVVEQPDRLGGGIAGMAAEEESTFSLLLMTLVVLGLSMVALCYWRRTASSGSVVMVESAVKKTTVITFKAGASIGRLSAKIAWKTAETLGRYLYYVLKTVVIDNMVSERWKQWFLEIASTVRLQFEEAMAPAWECEGCRRTQPAGTSRCTTEGCGAPGPSMAYGVAASETEEDGPVVQDSPSQEPTADRPPSPRLDPEPSLPRPAEAEDEHEDDLPPLEEVAQIYQRSDGSWELVSELARNYLNQRRTNYRRTGPAEIDEMVLRAVYPAMRPKLERPMLIPLSHIEIACKRRGLPVTGSLQMKCLFLAACESRRRTSPGGNVDAAVDGLPPPHLRPVDDRDLRSSERYRETGQVESERQVIDAFPPHLRMTLEIMRDEVRTEDLGRIIRGRGLPAGGTKLMKCIHLAACSKSRELYSDGAVDTVIEIPNVTTPAEQITETARGLIGITRIRLDAQIASNVLGLRGGGPIRPRTDGEEGAGGLNDHSPSFPSPFAQQYLMVVGSVTCVVLGFLFHVLKLRADAAGTGGAFVINSTSATAGEVIRDLGNLAQTIISTLEGIVEEVGMTWGWFVRSVRGFTNLVLHSSLMWTRFVIAVIAIGAIFHLVAAIAEDPDMFYFKDGLKFFWNLMRSGCASLCGRRRTRSQQPAPVRGHAMQRAADRHDGALRNTAPKEEVPAAEQEGGSVAADPKADSPTVDSAKAQQDQPQAWDGDPRVRKCHRCNGVASRACSVRWKMCCYKVRYHEESESCMSCFGLRQERRGLAETRASDRAGGETARATIEPWIASAGQNILPRVKLKQVRRQEILAGRLETAMAGATRPLLPWKGGKVVRDPIYAIVKDPAELLALDMIIGLVSEEDRDQVRFWNEGEADMEPRAQTLFMGYGARKWLDERPDLRWVPVPAGQEYYREVPRPSAPPTAVGDLAEPNVERWLVRGPSRDNGRDEAIVCKRLWDQLEDMEDERLFSHPSHSRVSISDWLRCLKCDQSISKHEEHGREMCVHCAFLTMRSFRANAKTKLFVGSRLNDLCGLDGSRQEVVWKIPGTVGMGSVTRQSQIRTPTRSEGGDAEARLEKELESARLKKEKQTLVSVPTKEGGAGLESICVEVTVSPTQTESELDWLNRIHQTEAAYLCLGKPLDPDDEDQLKLQHLLRLFCPKIEDARLPAMVEPEVVISKCHGKDVTFWQITRDLEGTGRHEMMVFFNRFEKYMMLPRLDGETPTYDNAWESLRRLLWGLAASLYKFLDQDYDDPGVLFAQTGSKCEIFRWLTTNGAAVYRKSTIAWEDFDLSGVYGAADKNVSTYDALVKYDFAGLDRMPARTHRTVQGDSERRPATEFEKGLLVQLEDPSDPEGGRGPIFVPAAETTNGKDPSRRIVLDTRSAVTVTSSDIDAASLARANAGPLRMVTDTTGRTSVAPAPIIPDGVVAERTRLALQRMFPSRNARSGTGPYIDGGAGQSPAVVYPNGANMLLDDQFARARSERIRRRSLQASGFNTNRRGNGESTSTGVDIAATGSSWDGIEDFFETYMPAAGTATAVPHVGLLVRDLDGLSRGNVHYRGHAGEVAIPVFFPFDGAHVVALCNGKQTRDLVCHLLDRVVAGEPVSLFGYTFDHPRIADRMTAAAGRGADVTMVLNSEEVEGETKNARTPSTLLRMMGERNAMGCGPSSTESRLNVRKSHGTALLPIYASWGRTLSPAFRGKKGAQHSKVFSAGKFSIVGSTNWAVSSEANQELAAAMYIEPNGLAFRSQVLADMSQMARAATYKEMQETDHEADPIDLTGESWRNDGGMRTE